MTAKFWVGGTATWDNTNDANWSLSSGGANNTTHPVAGDAVTLDGSSGGGTVTVNANLAVSTLTTSAFTGTLDFSANNNSITLSGAWTDAATGVHTVNMGNGTWTFTIATGSVVNVVAGANHTLNANSSTILLSATPTGSRQIVLGGKTINNLTVTNAAWSGFCFDWSGAGAFTIAGNLTLTNVGYVRPVAGASSTITGTWTWDGNSTNQGLISPLGAAATISVGAANTLSYVLFQNVIKAGAGSITVNNGWNGGGNTGVTINAPSGGAGGVSRARVLTGM